MIATQKQTWEIKKDHLVIYRDNNSTKPFMVISLAAILHEYGRDNIMDYVDYIDETADWMIEWQEQKLNRTFNRLKND